MFLDALGDENSDAQRSLIASPAIHSLFRRALDSPALACPAPLLAQAPTRASDWPALAAQPSSLTGPSGLVSAGPSAFSVVPPATLPAGLPLYNSLMCLPSLLERFSTPNVLRSHMSATSFKPIPNNEKVDLARFRVKDPNEWLVDDVVAWMLDIAKRHNIPFEEMNMHRFASLTGQHMLVMSERDFIDRDPTFGPLIFNEFRKANSNTEDTLIDDYMKNHPSDEETTSLPTTSVDIKPLQPLVTLPQRVPPQHPHQPTCIPQNMQQQLNNHLSSLTQVLTQASFNQGLLNSHNAVQSLNQSLASSLAAGLTTGLSPMSLGLLPNGLSPSSPLLSSQLQQPKISPMPADMMKYNPGSVSTDYDACEDRQSIDKIKKNKDGKPRKRSQHTKGNKLWEFIRDALKDPSTCPSVVRWEDPIEGVFRIVESEKLARLWGERKNNTKMTYEKLSRAMRTYYEKQILVPVPKTGLYPKKLVYKRNALNAVLLQYEDLATGVWSSISVQIWAVGARLGVGRDAYLLPFLVQLRRVGRRAGDF
ncbi:unnamed protein product [Caenorhabditis auriculariae]|uniref:ETS domain-containing protein n=1 Tax=Caenorhabditis auriculariae TaxID=2777116 RepID=A0A8S1GNB3_9PELO|nr:unnamed protein product [Caenorhabditis auriculariae]